MKTIDSNISRRQMLAQLGAASLLLAFGASCRRREATAPSKRNVRFYGTGTLDVGAAGWQALSDSLNIAVHFKDNGNDAGPVIGQMLSGTAATDYHLGGLLGGAERVLAEAGAILPWDLAKIPNWSAAWPWAKDIAHARWQGRQYGIPLVVNADSMIYRPDLLKKIPGYESGEVDSYAAVFDPRLKGKTSMEDAWVNSVIFTAIYLRQNKLQTIQDPGNLTESELRGVMEFLIEHKKAGQFRKFWNGWEQGVEIVRSGEVAVMTGWEPIVKAVSDQGIDARYAVPKEGYEGWSIDLLLHSGAAKHGLVDVCHEVANWMHQGDYGSRLALSRGYAVPNDSTVGFARAKNLPDAAKVAETIGHVQTKVQKTIFWQNVRPDNYRLYEEWWSKLRAAG